ncbi:hypothetical protein ASPZODRAFT_130249 [Penicilliopsis zonata CBS 506.65]|uniref:Importin N-terminal domain-containing protein n=1 Tax=Penicilliopsis zonata CBS 506.65 TaxID=1073090 RepID=A0A1L9SML7_9EURO|nr:hypothetical protein ASPZODRAFT_130249 [Penicilliopsis zonata CBS 506.65]OJJ48277.1 hypothetical protein ASPZODRAFT_130249 [Penicilliopsis zonata CBS 506.65]
MAAEGYGQASDGQVLIGEARNLVSQLYDPANAGNPAKIKLIQEHLQALQKGPQAWLIANDLLGSDSTDARFFGALTFTVKINHDWQQLGESDAKELLARLVDHYVFLVNGGERPMVIRKLASSLTTIFLKPNAPWVQALLNLAASLANGKHIPEEQCRSLDLVSTVLPAMTQAQVVALLYFSNILAEEVNKLSTEARKSDDSHRVGANIKDALSLVDFVLQHILQQEASNHPVADIAPGVEAINSYHSWMCVRGSIQVHDSVAASQLASTTRCVIQSLNVSQMSKTATQVIIELIDWRDSAFTEENIHSILKYIIGDHGTAHIVSLMDGDFDDDNMTYLELLLAYSTLKQRELFAGPLTPEYEKILTLLHTLFKAPGYAAVDDLASPLVLEWWTEVADDLQEIFMDAEEKTGFEHARQNLAQAAMDCFEKLMYPSPEELRTWSDDDRAELSFFRRDVCDFLLAIYPMLGVELVQVFQQKSKTSLADQDWKVFEAAIFCIAQLSEAVDENQHADDCLNAIFFADDFAHLCSAENVQITDKARQTLVDMLGKYQSYFERTHTLLPRVLTFLFASLNVTSSAAAASRSISYLCKSCRKALTLELPAFMDQFEIFKFKSTATSQTMERVLEGISAIIQTLPSDVEKAQYLERILQFFVVQAELARDEASRGLLEPAVSRAQLVLRCVASVGKGLRADADIVIDSNSNTNEAPYQVTFWNTGNGAASQNMIMQCMQLLVKDFSADITIVQAACDILKAGYTEKTGPYIFPPMVTVDFVRNLPLGTPGADIFMGTASAFLASHSSQPQLVRDEAVALVTHVYHIFSLMLENQQFYDPELANSGIDFLSRLLPKYHQMLFTLTTPPPSKPTGPPILQAILNFTVVALQGPEPLPLRSASQFWIGVFNLPSSNTSGGYDAVQSAIKEYLPALCRVLMTQIAGRCARSDVEHLCEVLRRIIFKQQGLAKPHLAATLAELRRPEGETSLPSPEERQRFLASLLTARGGKSQTQQLTRSFWVQCRGTGFNYARDAWS